MNLLGEINCFGICLKVSELAPLVALLIVISIALLAVSFMIRMPKHRLFTFVSAQVAAFLAIISTAVIFGALRFYDRLMIKRLNAKPIGNVIGWMQEFMDRLTNATVYYYDSAVPKAFAAGKSVFVSLGLLELLSDDELKAVLAHEAWHIRNNGRTPFLKQLAIMTFSSTGRGELEDLADRFAEELTGSEALSSAR
ncbi:MAG: M48 family metalloprotease, partial [Euryarchaeota archaeon]|nr:M48 family metalloprotease [Euryarchaeota archaeon]